ncbi:VWA domain-containing protein [Methylomonas sp. AM2-LC]|uniref:VWA domain-containing protein n=1 Tax=Methylomonas sp. AM2-LC TaxID=3153301 RepID=UPI00326477C6
MNFAEFHFLRPWWLLAMVPMGLLFWLLIKHKLSRGNWSEVCDAELLPFILTEQPLLKSSHRFWVAGIVGVLSILALAGPTWQRIPSPAFRNQSALVIALDLSATMDATDIKPSRISKARYKIADLLKQRKDGQTALMVYAGDAFTVTPLTTDTSTISSQLEALTTDIMPSPGSNTEVAVHKAAELLQQAGATQGHILLVTASVDPKADVDKWLGAYQLSVLAIGTADGAPIQQQGGGFLKDASGNIVVARLESSVLASLAQRGHGLYQLVSAGDEDVEKLHSLFNVLPADNKTAESSQLLQQWEETGPWLLFLVLPWAALRFRKGVLFWLGLCLLPLPRNSQALDWQSLWQNPNQRAQQAFEKQEYKQAADQFDNSEWRAAAQYKAGEYQQAAETLKNIQTTDGYYNRGNALAKAGQLEEAIQAYNQALQHAPDHQDAQYNKDLVEKQLQQQQKQQKQDQQTSDQKDQQQKQQSAEQKQSQQSEANQTDADQKQAQQQQSEQKDNQKQEKQSSGEDQQANKADKNEQQGDDKKADKTDASQDSKPHTAQSADEIEKDETARANEQLLKRIPDEPTGLLKRKFKYLYNQHDKAAHPLKW